MARILSNVFEQLSRIFRNHVELILLIALIAFLPLMLNSNFHLRVMVLVWIFALAAVGLNLLMGFAGQVSLGHAGFFAIGAYSTALGPSLLPIAAILFLPLGAIFASLIAFLIGRPILRLRGHYLAVATLGFGILIFMILTNQIKLTGGPDGMAVSRATLFGWQLRGNLIWYYITGFTLIGGAWLARNIVNSSTGLALRALRDDEVASSVMGIDVASYKLLTFVISAAYASVAGAMLALFDGRVTPGLSDFLVSVELVTMVVLGGMGSILGSVLGAAVLVAMPQFLTILHDYEHAMLGLIIILTMVFLPAGIVPTVTRMISNRGN